VKRHWIEYTDERRSSPMTYWVHTGPDGEHWRETSTPSPPLPPPVPGRGFPSLYVEYQGFTFTFASLHELDVCVDTLSMKNMPTSIQLSAARGSGAGPNRHWLSRLPATVTPWKYREGATKYLRRARIDFERELAET